MNPDDLARILDELGQRLGPTGEHVFALAVRQQIIVNGMWAAAFAVLVLGGGATAIYKLRTMWSTDRAIDGLSARIEDQDKAAEEIRAKVREYEAEKEAAQLAAMTDAERVAWFERMRMFPGFRSFGSYYTGSPSVSDIREHNEGRFFVALGGGICAVIGIVGLLLALPPLLNPEYAAIRDILSAIAP